MRKSLLVLLLFVFGMEGLHAEYVELSKAQRVAKGFTQNTFRETMRGGEPELFLATPDYYVFTVAKKGFVIVSADDRFRPVIGYSDEDSFGDPVSPELSYYLDNLSQGRRAAIRASMTQDEMVRAEWDGLLHGNPLPSRNGGMSSFYLVKTRWDQGDPYNKFCPPFNGGTHSYAGCVATAMSQVMYYWKHPTHGYGNHSYVHPNYGELSADFSAADYNFDIMTPSLAGVPQEAIDEVALFMYHCGIAVNMSYSTSGSGAYSQDVPEAVMSYFDYSNRCRYHLRDSYTLSEFQAILKDQFDLGWPCYYSGSDPDAGSGHAFVCDGYDDHDMFHFNWGWSGSGNGYYAIDELNVSGYGWNSGQAVITNFVPATVIENTAKTPEQFHAESNADDQFSVTLSWVNPTSTIVGAPIEIIDKIEVIRNGVVVKTIDSVAPGEAMTCVDTTGLPIIADYSVCAVLNDIAGRKATFQGLRTCPTCEWTVKMRSESETGWGSGNLTIANSSGMTEGTFAADGNETVQTASLSSGWLSFHWIAPADSLTIGFDIIDAEGSTVFSYDGLSSLMPQGLFYEMVNSCGGRGCNTHPTNLVAMVDGDDVLLNWTGIQDPGYGYNIYRDGFLYSMVPDTTSFADVGAAATLHSYSVTAYTQDGESDASNICSIITADDAMCPKNYDYEILDNEEILLSWEAPENTENLSGYRMYRCAEGEDDALVKNMSASHTSYSLRISFDDGTRYQYKLVAIYDHGTVESAPAYWTRYDDMRYVEINYTHLPSRLTLEHDSTLIQLQWEPAWLADSYNIYRNGELIREGVTETAFLDSVPSSYERREYYVTGVKNGVESSPSNKVSCGSAAVNENNLAVVSIYPNPTKGTVVVEAPSMSEVAVYNYTGQMVCRAQTTHSVVSLNLSALAAGVYSVRVVTQQGTHLEKLVLTK